MTNDDEVFGYQDGSEQLADYAERFGLRCLACLALELLQHAPSRVRHGVVSRLAQDAFASRCRGGRAEMRLAASRDTEMGRHRETASRIAGEPVRCNCSKRQGSGAQRP
ncbi:MAG: hypothetical protein JWO36_5081 [Myxococcales bacterium]|nr:hypothetical protein [Myxococcales bacterium]